MRFQIISLLALIAAQFVSAQPRLAPQTVAQFHKLPMQFEPNVGQAAEPVKFLSHGPGYTLLLTPVETVLFLRPTGSTRGKLDNPPDSRHHWDSRQTVPALPQTELRFRLLDANDSARLEGIDELPGTVNYFIGNDPRLWHTAIRSFSKVKYTGIYPDIDLIYYGNQRQMEYDFIVGPSASPQRITLGFSGEDSLEIDGNGELVAHTTGGVVRWRKPIAYQETVSGNQEVAARFVLRNEHQVGFEVATYDVSRPLVIDPVVVYSTYLGGSGDDIATGIAVDPAGNNAVVAGFTTSLNFPTASAYRSTAAGSNDIFITKFNNAGSGVVFSTYLGGSGNDYANAMDVDSAGNVYVTGNTDSQNFPTRNAYSSANSGFNDIFIAKLGPFGTNLLYASYLGGGGDDSGDAIAVDNNGNAYVAGHTYSIGTGNSPFPVVPHNAYQTKNNGGRDAFVAKFDTTSSGSSSLSYSTFLGGSTDEKAWAIAVDANSNAVVVGEIQSFNNTPPAPPTSDFPVLNAFEPQFNLGSTNEFAGSFDGFVTKLTSDGTGLIFSTFLGGGDDDLATGVTLDAAGRIYVTGQSASPDFITTTNAFQPLNAGMIYDTTYPGIDAFVTVFQPNGTLYYSTLLGGTGDENGFDTYPFGIAVDQFGAIYVAGQTDSEDFPITSGADQTNSFGSPAIFISKIHPAVYGSNSLVYSTFFSGDTDANGRFNAANYVAGIAVDTNGNFFVAGTTTATNFPTTNYPGHPFRSSNSGGVFDTVVAKFSSPHDLSVAMFPSLEPVIVGSNFTYTIQVNNNGSGSFTGVTNSIQLSTNVQLLSVTTTAGNYSTNYNSATGWLVSFNLGTVTNYSAVTQTITLKTLYPGFTTNMATLTSIDQATPGFEPNTNNNIAIIPNTILGIVDVKINQLSGPPNPVFAGSNFNYTIAVGNKGQYIATSITVTDSLPPQVSFNWATNTQATLCTTDLTGTVNCTLYNLTNGSSATVTINVTATAPGTGMNFAAAIPFDYDFNLPNNFSNLVTTVISLADLALGQSSTAASLYAGSTVTYNFSITNFGPYAVNNAVLTNQLPAGFAFVSFANSQGTASQVNGLVTWSLGAIASNGTAQVSVTARPTIAGTYTNAATITSEAADPFLANNSASVVTMVNPAADLVVSQIAAPTSLLASSNVTFTFAVTNKGPSPATSVTLADPLPPGFSLVSAVPSQGTATSSNGVILFNLGSLASNAMATATVIATPRFNGTFTNAVSVSANEFDANVTNNSASVAIIVNDNPNAPLLKIARAGTNVLLSWGTNMAGFLLQKKSSVYTNISWTPVTNLPMPLGNQFFVTNYIVAGGQFYRLLKGTSTSLTIVRAGTNVVIFWPAYAGGVLKAAPTLSNNMVWTPITNVPSLQSGVYYVTNPFVGRTRFFRLFN